MKAPADASDRSPTKHSGRRSTYASGVRRPRPLSRLQEVLLIATLISVGGMMQMLIVLKVAGFGD
jgi:hypothetical protein